MLAGRAVFCVLQKLHRLFVDREDDAASFAHHAVPGAGRVDEQPASGGGAILIPLCSGENDDVLVAGVRVERHHAILAETEVPL